MADIDTTEIGVVAAKVMEDLEQTDQLGENPKVMAAMVIYEVADDDGNSTVGARCTDDRNVLGLGLLARASEALLNPDGDLSED